MGSRIRHADPGDTTAGAHGTVPHRTTLFTAALLIVAACAAPPCALAAESPQDLARQALKAGEYQKVLDLTPAIVAAEPASAVAWYRQAIAAERLGRFDLAAKSLSAARDIDPKMRYASSPERVEQLHQQIERGIRSSQPSPDVEAPSYPPEKELKASAAQPPAGPASLAQAPAPPSAIGESATHPSPVNSVEPVAPMAASAAVAAVESPPVAPEHPIETPNSSNPSGLAAWVIGFFIFAVGSLLMAAQAFRRAFHRLSLERERCRSSMSLSELILDCRDAVAILDVRLLSEGHSDSELKQVSERLLPVLEREAGRAQPKAPALAPPAGEVIDLTPRPPVLGRSDPASLHGRIARAAIGLSR